MYHESSNRNGRSSPIYHCLRSSVCVCVWLISQAVTTLETKTENLRLLRRCKFDGNPHHSNYCQNCHLQHTEGCTPTAYHPALTPIDLCIAIKLSICMSFTISPSISLSINRSINLPVCLSWFIYDDVCIVELFLFALTLLPTSFTEWPAPVFRWPSLHLSLQHQMFSSAFWLPPGPWPWSE